MTNSFHGIILSAQFRKAVRYFFKRTVQYQIQELLDLFGTSDRIMVNGDETISGKIDHKPA